MKIDISVRRKVTNGHFSKTWYCLVNKKNPVKNNAYNLSTVKLSDAKKNNNTSLISDRGMISITLLDYNIFRIQ